MFSPPSGCGCETTAPGHPPSLNPASSCKQIVHCMPFLLLAVVSCIFQSIASKNKNGESRQPCRTPVNTFKVSLVLPS